MGHRVRTADSDGRLSARVVDTGALMEASSFSAWMGRAGVRGVEREQTREKREENIKGGRGADEEETEI